MNLKYVDRKDEKKIRHKCINWIGYFAIICLLIFIAFIIFSPLLKNSTIINTTEYSTTIITTSKISQPKAVIVDQIAVIQPNTRLLEATSRDLSSAGFEVDVLVGDNVTIDFFRTLPDQGYKLIIFRIHSTNITLQDGPVFLFTGEKYRKGAYVYEQLTNQVGAVRTFYENSSIFFAVGPEFVRRSMIGQFEETMIIIGGCQSLSNLQLANALINRGASTIIGWDDWVDLDHNDRAIERLLQALLIEQFTVEGAVEITMNDIGLDPIYKANLSYYPREKGHYDLSGLNMIALDYRKIISIQSAR